MKQAYQSKLSDPAKEPAEHNTGNQFYQKGDGRVAFIWTSLMRTVTLGEPQERGAHETLVQGSMNDRGLLAPNNLCTDASRNTYCVPCMCSKH